MKMRKVSTLLNCVNDKIKKFFFKSQKNDINHACEKLKEIADEVTTLEEFKHSDEYALKYNTTTRWQTL